MFGCGKLCKQTGEIEADLASTWLPQVCEPLSLTLPYVYIHLDHL